MRLKTRSSKQTSHRIPLYALAVALTPLVLIGACIAGQTGGQARLPSHQAGQALPLLTTRRYAITSASGFGRDGVSWHVAVEPPRAALSALAAIQDSPSKGWEPFGRMMLAILVIILLAAGLYLLLGDRITRPIRRLAWSGRVPSKPGLDEKTVHQPADLHDAEIISDRGISTFGRIGRVITSSLDLNTLLDDMANHLCEITNATGSLIILLDPETQRLVPMAAYGEYYDDYRDLELGTREPSAVATAMSQQQPLIIRDIGKSLLAAPQLSHSHPDKSLLVLPLIAKSHTIGAAMVGDNRRVRDFSRSEVEMAMAVAGHFAVAIDNARLFASAQRHLHDLSLLYQTSATISATLDEQAVVEMAIQAFRKVFDVAKCRLVVWAPDLAGRLGPQRHPETMEAAGITGTPFASNSLLKWIGENRIPLLVRQDEHELWKGLNELVHTEDLQSALILPLVAKRDIIGCIVLLAKNTHRFSSEEISLAQTLANQIAGVVQNARLYRQMEEEKRKFELAALNMGEGLVILDREDALLFVNPQAQAMLGLRDGPYIGMSLSTACPQPQLLNLLERRTLSGEVTFSGELRAGDPELRDLTLSIAPVRDETGELEWWIIVIHDISELKELDRLKSEFISTVSHELRSPLASIMGFSEMIMTKQPGPLTSVQEEFMSIICESSENLLALVNDLLDVSRMESGGFALQIRWVDLNDLTSRTYSALLPLAQQKPLNLVLEIPDNLPQVAADPHRLEQVLTNLIHNAVKFTPAGGKVKVVANQEEAAVLFSVSDTGIGIPAQDMERLFTKFYRSAQVMQSAIAGTGLGLYIAKNIVESHGGSIGAESIENKGTTFWFTIPLDGPVHPEVE